ncbi:hypothetical protein EHW58_10535 [Salinivibrio sp. VYel1]|nr:hypothetical protein [Salinivibrio sp. VYel1]MPX91203.1 hypothetical protein [Salinivibrio sp. VYel1]
MPVSYIPVIQTGKVVRRYSQASHDVSNTGLTAMLCVQALLDAQPIDGTILVTGASDGAGAMDTVGSKFLAPSSSA